MAKDIGLDPTDNNDGFTNSAYTLVEGSNPASVDGTITTVYIAVGANTMQDVVVAVFSASGNDLTTTDSVAVGDLGVGLHEITVDLSVSAGQYIGVYGNPSGTDAHCTWTSVGTGSIWYKSGDNIPCTGETFASLGSSELSLGGAITTTTENAIFFGNTF